MELSLCIVNPTSAVAVQHLLRYRLCRSQGIYTYCAFLSRAVVKEVIKEVSLCLYWTFPPLPTVNQSCECGAIRRPPQLLQNLGGASRCGAQFGLCRPPQLRHTLHTEPPNHIFRSSINWLLGLSVFQQWIFPKTAKDVTCVSQNTMQRECFLRALLRHVSTPIGSKGREPCSLITFLYSNLTVT